MFTPWSRGVSFLGRASRFWHPLTMLESVAGVGGFWRTVAVAVVIVHHLVRLAVLDHVAVVARS